MTGLLKTPSDWLKEPQFAGIEILDPDGWRTPFSPDFDEPTSLEDFTERLFECTIKYPRGTFPKTWSVEGHNFID